MSTELVLLLVVYAFVLVGVFFGDSGPKATFEKSAPKLAARIEANITTGSGFKDPMGGNSTPPWRKPDNRPAEGF